MMILSPNALQKMPSIKTLEGVRFVFILYSIYIHIELPLNFLINGYRVGLYRTELLGKVNDIYSMYIYTCACMCYSM